MNIQKDFIKPIYRIKVMSLNMHHGTNKYGFYNLHKVSQFIKEQNVDIIGVQEVDKNVFRSKFHDQARQLACALQMFYVFGPNIDIGRGQYGNAILTRYPIKDYKNIMLPSARENRGLLISQIQVGAKKVNFFVTHLGLTKQERKDQIRIIRKNIDAYNEKVILAGDFNCKEDSEEMKVLKEILVDVNCMRNTCYPYTYEAFGIKSRIDYIFVSKDIRVFEYNVLKTSISDHFPIDAYLEI